MTFKQYLIDQGIGENTATKYNYQANMFIRFLGIKTKDDLLQIDDLINKIIEFCNSKFIVERKLGEINLVKVRGKNRVYIRKYSVIKFFEYHKLDDIANQFKKRTKGKMKLKSRKKIDKSLNIDEYNKLIKNLPEKYSLIVEIMFWGALRIEEVLSLKRKNIKKIDNKIRISNKIKGDKNVTVFMPVDLSNRLIKYINNKCHGDENIKLFDMSYNTFWFDIKKYGKDILGKDISSHEVGKHTRSQFEFNRGTPLDEIKEILHHSDIKTTLIYKSEAGIDSKKVVEEREGEV